MKKTGQLLKDKRESSNLSLGEVALATKINPKILSAIERGDESTLPAKTILKGFVRAYALFLKMDVEDVLRTFQEEMGGAPPVVERVTESASDSTKKSRREVNGEGSSSTIRTASVVVIILLIGLIIGIRELIEKYQAEKVTPVETAELEKLAPVTPPALPGEAAIGGTVAMATSSPAMVGEMTTSPTTAPVAAVTLDPKAEAEKKVADEKAAAEKAAADKAAADKAAAEKVAADKKAAEEQAAAEKKAAAEKAIADKKAEEKRVAEEKAAAKKAAEEKIAADKAAAAKALADKKAEDKRLADEKKLAEEKAAAEKKAADKAAADKKAEEKKIADEKAAADKKAAADRKAADEKAAAEAAAAATPGDALKGLKNEIILEAKSTVEVKFKIKGEEKRVSLNANEVHTIRADQPVTLDLSDGGAVSIIFNGRDRGVPGDAGKPKTIKIP
jgi:cytoskeletal protein RodZ